MIMQSVGKFKKVLTPRAHFGRNLNNAQSKLQKQIIQLETNRGADQNLFTQHPTILHFKHYQHLSNMF